MDSILRRTWSKGLDIAKDVGLGLAKGAGEMINQLPNSLIGVGPVGIRPEFKQETLKPANLPQQIGKAISLQSPSEVITPAVEKLGIDPRIAFALGIGADVIAPGIGEGEIRGGQKVAKEIKELLVVHNLSENKLRFADRIGGLVNPSTAVINPKKTAFENYGEISLIGDKELIRGEKTHLADAYTPRFPSVHTSMDSSDYQKLNEEFKPYYKKIGEDAREIGFDDTDMVRRIENNPAVMLKFLESKGIKPTKEGQHYYYPQIKEQKLEEEYQTFLNQLYEKYNLKEQMFAGYTASGKRRYKPVSIEEASKIMSKQKDEGFNYGLGSFRSKIAPIKTSPEAVKKEAGRLVSKEDFTKIKDSYDDELWQLKIELEPYAKNLDSNPFTENDRQLQTIGDVLTGEDKNLQWFNSKFPNTPENIKNKIFKFKEKLKEMPTEYFETKFKRPVKLEEFKIAVVPDTISDSIRGILEKKGLQIIKYAKGEKEKVMKDLLEHPEAFAGLPLGIGLTSSLGKHEREYQGPEKSPYQTMIIGDLRDTKPLYLGPIKHVPQNVPQEWKRAIEKAYEDTHLPVGIIETVLMKESEMGRSSKNLGGFYQSAKDALTKNKIPFDLSTPEGQIDAIAKYLKLRSELKDDSGKTVKTITDPVELYMNRYYTKKNAKQDKKLFEYYYNAYKKLYGSN